MLWRRRNGNRLRNCFTVSITVGPDFEIGFRRSLGVVPYFPCRFPRNSSMSICVTPTPFHCTILRAVGPPSQSDQAASTDTKASQSAYISQRVLRADHALGRI